MTLSEFLDMVKETEISDEQARETHLWVQTLMGMQKVVFNSTTIRLQ